MEQYVIKGGRPLAGEVTIAGAKNAALGILAAAVMTDQEVTIENVPNVRDTRVLLQAIQGIGMIMAVDPADVDKTVEAVKAAGETPYVIGKIEAGEKGVKLV